MGSEGGRFFYLRWRMFDLGILGEQIETEGERKRVMNRMGTEGERKRGGRDW